VRGTGPRHTHDPMQGACRGRPICMSSEIVTLRVPESRLLGKFSVPTLGKISRPGSTWHPLPLDQNVQYASERERNDRR
jgi:hypothetical protein